MMKKQLLFAAALLAAAAGIGGGIGLLSAQAPTGGPSVIASAVISLANTLTTIGNFPLTFTTTASTSVTLPTSGTLVASPVASAQLSPTTIQFISVPLTLLQLTALNTAPPTIIAAQGAGTLVELQSCTLELVFGSAAFTGGGVVHLSYGGVGGADAAGTFPAAMFTTFAATQSATVTGVMTTTSRTNSVNVPIELSGSTANFAAGTGATGLVECAYRVHTGF